MPSHASYTTVEEVMALYALTKPKAELLLVKTNAVLDHGKMEPDGVADAEDKKLWVEEGYARLVSPNTAIPLPTN